MQKAQRGQKEIKRTPEGSRLSGGFLCCTNFTRPTGALNSKTGLDVLDTLTKFNEQGQNVVMVTHDIRSARRGNRILYLKDGVILGECRLGPYVPGDEARHSKLSAFLTEMGW